MLVTREAMMKTVRYKATMILGAAVLGMLLSWQFRQGFWGGLLYSGFAAAVVGGLADWFAVAALFRRPLGIPFRTAIIPRNRDKIFQALADMVGKEILVRENIQTYLANYQVAGLVLHFFGSQHGRGYVKKILYRFMQDLTGQLKPEELAAAVDGLIAYNKDKINLAGYLIKLGEWVLRQGYQRQILEELLLQLRRILQQPPLQHFLAEIFVRVLAAYEQGMERRKFFNELVSLSPQQLAAAAVQALDSTLFQLQQPGSELRIQLESWLKAQLEEFKENAERQAVFNNWLYDSVLPRLQLGQQAVAMAAAAAGDGAAGNKRLAKLAVWAQEQLEEVLTGIAADPAAYRQLDEYLKHLLVEWLDANHSEIGTMIINSLQGFSNERLIEFIEEKVGNDLQMIRINGSIVGGLAGMTIHLLTFWL